MEKFFLYCFIILFPVGLFVIINTNQSRKNDDEILLEAKEIVKDTKKVIIGKKTTYGKLNTQEKYISTTLLRTVTSLETITNDDVNKYINIIETSELKEKDNIVGGGESNIVILYYDENDKKILEYNYEKISLKFDATISIISKSNYLEEINEHIANLIKEKSD